MAAGAYANVFNGVVVEIDIIDPDLQSIPSGSIPIDDVTCADDTPVVLGCTYDGSVFTSMPKDVFGRSIAVSSDGITDTYRVTDPYGNDGVFSFPFETAQATAYAAINGNGPTLAQAIAENLMAFEAAIEAYTRAAFSTDTRISLMGLYLMATSQATPMPDLAAYIAPLFPWIQSVLRYANTYAAAIRALTDIPTIYSTGWNIAGNTTAIPVITLAEAASISD